MRTLILALALACFLTAAFNARAQAPDPNHTVVRLDVFTGGTNFGKIDIELFDQEKPETVQNFLIYVYSGGYSNLVLHRLEPNFVIQAGHVRVDDPASTNIFSSYPLSTDFGGITNEYEVGPQLTNDFGTIAMARVSGQTNSASADWFINLTNNARLDTVDGGFTVFGRVVNAMDDRSGTNLLNYFNTFSTGQGIRSVFIAEYGESLTRLPVATNRPGSAIQADLFTVRPSFIQGGLPPDSVPPSLALTQPADLPVIVTTNSTITFSGTAADNQAVARVLYDTPSAQALVANGKESWTAEVNLEPGTNRISVRSVDYFGNVSPAVERLIFRGEPLDPNHTVIRFDISAGGTNFGKIDIELFDQEKPETVRNFLLYVYSGAYSNLVLHRLVPNFVVQAGHVRVDDPASTNTFSGYPLSTNFGKITNEYAIGPELTNGFGTIAMARVAGQTNSATTDWFINLKDNPSLNTNDGGFTVFGRVVNAIDERSGTNLLNYFSTFTSGHGIRSVFISEYGENLASLPVVTNRAGSPVFADLFTVQPSFVQGGVLRDTVSPSLQINQPIDSAITTTNSSITISGTAADNQAVARVLYDASFEHSLVANGTENWTVEVPLHFGTNRISVRSVDYFGNVSLTVERVIFRRDPPAAPNHTVVRFAVFTGGTNFGNIDIELFDQEKPETVGNFLLYVYSGSYSNVVLHRLAPNFVLQAGHVRVDDPSGLKVFSNYTRNPDFGRITNEYDAGPQLANDFGTIAMARAAGETNSASVDWFINLTNNASLNTNDGGSTVFGRVVNTIDDRSGISLLNYFNGFRAGLNIRGFTIGSGERFDIPGPGMPVSEYHSERFPLTREMFMVQASFLQGGVPRDNVAPIVQVNDPASGAVIITTSSNITFSGTAADNQEVARVLYDTPAGSALPVNGKENWAAEVSLVPGTNRITVRGVDYFGNVGTAARTIFRAHSRSVDFRIEGKGKVTGITNGQSFLVDLSYTLVAKPSAQQYFLGWRDHNDTLLSGNHTFNFTMREYTTNIVAVFSRTLFGITNGAYRGLFFPGTTGPSRSAGTIAINVAANGRYSGRLTPLGANYAIRGKFDASGTNEIKGPQGSDLVLRLSFYSKESIFGTYSDGHSLSSVGLWHVEKFTRANPAPQAGSYTFLISPTLDTQIAAVGGYGFGSVIIDTLGRIKMTGTLADQTAIRQTSTILAGDLWAFFASAKRGREVVLGVASFASNNVFNADLKWFSDDFPGEINQNARLSGSPYVPPLQGRLFNWTNGVVALSGGGLPAAIFANVLLNEDGSFAIPFNPNNIQLSLPDAAGGITGNFTHPITSALTPLRGAVLQSSNMAAGFFPGGASSGAFTIRPQ